MKKSVQFLLAGSLFSLLLLASCAKDDTEPSIQVPSFQGHWLISEQSSVSGNSSYYVDITDSTNSIILFAYLNGYHTKIRANVSGNNFSIPSQIVEGNSVSGGGTLTNSNQINMNYLVWLGGSSYDTITASLIK